MKFDELKNLKRWVAWKYVTDGSGRTTKKPKNAMTGGEASSINSDTWCTYDEAVDGADKYDFDGVGVVFTGDFFGIDLDKCISDDGTVTGFAKKICEYVDGYTEKSVSGTGIHIIGKGTIPELLEGGGKHKGHDIEMYTTGRYFTVSGDMLTEGGCTDIPERIEQGTAIYRFILFYDELKYEKMKNKELGKLWNIDFNTSRKDKSEVDHALIKELLKFTHGDEFVTDLLFRLSMPYKTRKRSKWDVPHSSDKRTYGEMTIAECKEQLAIENEAFKDKIADASFFNDRGRLIDNRYDDFAELMIQHYSLCKIGDLLHMYDNGVYVSDADRIKAAIDRELIVGDDREVDTLYKKIFRICTEYRDISGYTKQLSSENYIPVENGVYNTDTRQLEPFTNDIVVLSKIPTAYKPDAYSKAVDDALNMWSCNDSTVRALLEEMIGTCLYRKNFTRKMFILLGNKRNGKSTFLELIQSIIGNGNTLVCDLHDMERETNVAEFYGKLLCVTDDMGDVFVPNTGIIKSLVSGGTVKGRKLYGKPFYFNNYATMLFCANEIPRITDKHEAVTDRFVIIPFKAHFSENADHDAMRFKNSITTTESKEYLLKLAIDGLHRVLDKGFTKCELVEDEIQQYRLDNNPILRFLVENGGREYIIRKSCSEVYTAYKTFCTENGIKTPATKTTMSKEIKERYHVELKPTSVRVCGIKNPITTKIYVETD